MSFEIAQINFIVGLEEINGSPYPPEGGGTSVGPINTLNTADGSGGWLDTHLTVNTTGDINAPSTHLQLSSASNAAILKQTSASHQITLDPNTGVSIVAGSGLPVNLNAIEIHLNNYKMPQLDGTAGQVLETDGAGQVSFVTPSAGGGSVGDSGAIQTSDGAGGFADSGLAATTPGTLDLNPADPNNVVVACVSGDLLILQQSAGGKNITISNTSGGTTDITNTINSLSLNGTTSVNMTESGSNNRFVATSLAVSMTDAINDTEISSAGAGFAIKISSDTGSAGNVLTADGTGFCAWQAAAAGGGCAFAPPDTVFVSSICGNDANPGTLAAPVATLTQALILGSNPSQAIWCFDVSTFFESITVLSGVNIFAPYAQLDCRVGDAPPGSHTLIINGSGVIINLALVQNQNGGDAVHIIDGYPDLDIDVSFVSDFNNAGNGNATLKTSGWGIVSGTIKNTGLGKIILYNLNPVPITAGNVFGPNLLTLTPIT